MKRKHLESALSSIQREFPDPKITLEQYPTSPSLTASVILTALERGDLGPGTTALDLGCGTGMLTLGCALIETDLVLALDCDSDALQLAKENVEEMELETAVEWIHAQVASVISSSSPSSSTTTKNSNKSNNKRRFPPKGNMIQASTLETRQLIAQDKDGVPLHSRCVDTVLTNPPFGTKQNAGMDLRFLRTACRLARRTVYSFHKTSTRAFLQQQVTAWGYSFHVVAEMQFDLPQVYKFHKEKSRDIAVDLIRVDLICMENLG
ncbi:putative methylase [Fistulifera solaris]|uniref:Putative methylase n=1 Tax=Fistulifera solaris TaxID=1519565 RepID=A0A1Z5JUU6_FISSO|nr:putative methylase [Fistulifera solaris]|eukprot:GAX17612.1 putative methylase [Fistulifera solaris]